jgi:hypothetical protein
LKEPAQDQDHIFIIFPRPDKLEKEFLVKERLDVIGQNLSGKHHHLFNTKQYHKHQYIVFVVVVNNHFIMGMGIQFFL